MSKPKLLIVGDSYGCKLSSNDNLTGWFDNKLLINNYDIKNCSVPGNSQMFIHGDFRNRHREFDKVIYIVTSPPRHTWTDHNNEIHRETGNLGHLKSSIKKHPDPIVKHKKGILLNYITHFLDVEVFNYASCAMVTEAMELRPDIVLLHAFSLKITSKLTGSTFSVSEMSNNELTAMDINHAEFLPKDGRPAHLIQENNDILAKFLYEKLNGSDRILKQEDFILPSLADRKIYFPGY